MEKFSIIICGGGPAGAAAAEAAARAGQRVLLLEKERLPRYKPCGGGMPMVVGEHLRSLAPEAFVEAEVRHMRHTWNFDRPYLAPINPSDCGTNITLWMVQRSVFDHALVKRAVEAGAELLDGHTVHAIESLRSGLVVRGETREGSAFAAAADHVIGADGANGITARAAGLRSNRSVAVAVEVEQPHHWGAGHPELRPDVMHLEYGAVSRGYAWVFPKAGHLSVGAGTFQPERSARRSPGGTGPVLKEAVFRYLDYLGVPHERGAVRFHAHPIPIWNRRERLHSRNGRILLVGDAAGLVNPLFGDGILHAIKSGILAAECIRSGTSGTYTRSVHRHFAGTFTTAARLAALLYDWAGPLYDRGICRPRATHLAAQLLCGESITPDLLAYVMKRVRTVLRDGGAQPIREN